MTTHNTELVTGRYQTRCKSGFVMQSTGHECRRMASRGMLMCGECLSATVVPTSVSTWAWTGSSTQRLVVAAMALVGVVVGIAARGVWNY